MAIFRNKKNNDSKEINEPIAEETTNETAEVIEAQPEPVEGEPQAPAATNGAPPSDEIEKISAIREILFGSNIQEYSKEFKEIKNLIKDNTKTLNTKIKDLKSDISEQMSDSSNNLSERISDSETRLNNKIEDTNQSTGDRIVSLEDSLRDQIDSLKNTKTDREKLATMFESLTQELRS